MCTDGVRGQAGGGERHHSRSMVRRPAPLPDALVDLAFSVGEGTDAGLSRGRMRSQDLASPFHGTRAPRRRLSATERCAVRASTLPPYAAVSHRTAGREHGLPLPFRLAIDETVHVSVPEGKRAPEGRGTRGHAVRQRPDEADRRYGFLCTTPARTFCDLAAELSLAELIAVGDHILRVGLATFDQLQDTVLHHPARRGRPRLRRALDLLDARAESPKESELRVLLIEGGLALPELQHEIRDEVGRFVGRVDLAYPALKIAIEYEGDHHRDRGQWQRDLARRRCLEALGWRYVTVTQTDLDSPGPLLSDLRRLLAR